MYKCVGVPTRLPGCPSHYYNNIPNHTRSLYKITRSVRNALIRGQLIHKHLPNVLINELVI